jgi:hypothetical protein
VQALPVGLLLVLLPGPWWLRLSMPLFVLLCAAFVAGAYADDLRDRRLRQHGLPPPYREPPPRGY